MTVWDLRMLLEQFPYDMPICLHSVGSDYDFTCLARLTTQEILWTNIDDIDEPGTIRSLVLEGNE